MARFKKVALKNADNVIDELYDYDEPDINRQNLDLSKIHMYLHQLSHLAGVKLFKLRLCYGKIAEDKTFQTLEEHFTDDVYSSLKIQQYHVFDYINGYNNIKIELYNPNNDEEIMCHLILDLRDLNANRFIKKELLMKNENLLESAESYRFPFTHFEISFFLQTHTASQHSEMMQQRITAIS